MKFVKRILGLILLIAIIVASIFICKGYSVYKKALEEISVKDKQIKIREEKNYTYLEDTTEFYRNAVIVTEDRRFYDHGAIDSLGIARAIVTNFKKKEFREGGSSITQQLAKNIYFTQEKSATRKIAELFMAFELEKELSKDEILELYINTSYFGNGYYCIADAAKGYFGTTPKEMNEYEASMLAGVPNAPSAYAPNKHLDLAEQRQAQVLNKMVKYNYITEERKNEIISSK